VKKKVSDIIPELLEDVGVFNCTEYCEVPEPEFSLTLNPEGNRFSKKVWQALQQNNLMVKTFSYLEIVQNLR